MADYSSSTQRKITQQIDIEFRLDVQEAKKLAIEGRKSSKASQEGIKAIEASISKVNRALEKAQRSTGKRNKTEKEQIAFENQKRKNIDKLKQKYKELTAALNTLYAVETKREITSRKQAALDAKRAKDSTFVGGVKRGSKAGTNSFIGGIGSSVGVLSRYLVGGALIGALAAVANGFRTAVKLGLEYEEQLARLAAITGTTVQEAEELGNAAFELAGKTRFSVQEIVKLQEALAKLGFNKDEIVDAQDAVAALAAATGEDLAKAAELTGKLLRAFSLEAASADRVANVLVSTVNNSAATLESLGTALQYVSPIAAQFGITLEETNAAVATLLNQGFTASRAGTGLRQILLETAKAGETLSQTLTRIKKEGLTATQAVELVGKRGAPALLALVNNVSTLEDLTDKVGQNFSEIVAEAKTLTTTQSAWRNLGVAIQSAVTKSGFFRDTLRDIGINLQSIFDQSAASKGAFSEVVSSLTEADLAEIAEAGQDQARIASLLFERLIELRNKGVLSRDEFIQAQKGGAFEAQVEQFLLENNIADRSLAGFGKTQDTIKSRRTLPTVDEVDRAAEFQGAGVAKDLVDRGIEEAQKYISSLNESLQTVTEESDKAFISGQLEAWNQYVTQLLSVSTEYSRLYENLTNADLERQKKIVKAEIETTEARLQSGKVAEDQVKDTVSNLDKLNEQLAAIDSEQKRR